MSNAHLKVRRLALIEAAITGKALDCMEISQAVFAERSYMIRLMRELLDAGMVRIVGWRLYARTYAALYQWGGGESAPRPLPKPKKEVARAFRARRSADPIGKALYLARDRGQRRAREAKSNPQTWLSALMPVSAGKSGATDKPAKHNKT